MSGICTGLLFSDAKNNDFINSNAHCKCGQLMWYSGMTTPSQNVLHQTMPCTHCGGQITLDEEKQPENALYCPAQHSFIHPEPIAFCSVCRVCRVF